MISQMVNSSSAKKWLLALAFLFGVPGLFIWAITPYLDMTRAAYLKNKGQNEEALRLYDRVIRSNAKSKEAYAGKGDVYYKMGDLEQAEQQYEKVVELEPADYRYWNQKAWILTKMGKHDQAVADATKSLALNPHAYTFDTRGYAYAHLRKYDEALKDFQRALELDPKLGDAYFHRAQVYDETNKKDLAAADRLQAKKCHFTEDN